MEKDKEIDISELEKEESKKIQVLQQKIGKLNEEVLKLQAHQDIIIDTVRREVVALPAVRKPKIPIPRTKFKEECACLEFSDVQIGSLVVPKETSRLANYNKNKMKKRIDKLIQSVFEVVEIQRNAGIPLRNLKLHVLGDIVQGESVFAGQAFKLDAHLMEQVFVLGDDLVDRLFLPLTQLFEKIEVFCIAGNHGKQGKPGDASRLTNWDYVVYWLWKVRMKNIKQIKFYISATPFLLYEMYPEQVHCLIHGNQARGWLGFPYYGVDRMYRRLTSLTGVYIMYLHHGHHHQPSMQDTHIGKKIGNGSIEGGSDYSVNDLLTANVPQQFFFGINEKGMTWEYWLRLEDYPKLRPDKDGILTQLMFEDTEDEISKG
jgi:hypothetical protein